ncbi:MAG: hypothetical protein WCO04_18725 [Pseudomonadota bacterium]|jgi:hypothetical protein
MYTLIKFLSVNQAVLEKNGKTYVASFADVQYSGPEVLVFKSNPDGEILDWSEVDGGRGYTSLQQFLSTVLHNSNYPSYTS